MSKFEKLHQFPKVIQSYVCIYRNKHTQLLLNLKTTEVLESQAYTHAVNF